MQTTTAIMGILNVTPDSFSDGGCYVDLALATARATDMIQAGAMVVDIGGESTRPGAKPVTALEQIQRVVPVIEAVHQRWGARVAISIDTTLAAVADAAIIAGASMVNDVSAGTDDPELFACCAQHGSELVLMHRQGQSTTMNHNPQYRDVVQEVKAGLLAQADLAIQAGVAADKLWLDPVLVLVKAANII